jgi:hypothetical protein
MCVLFLGVELTNHCTSPTLVSSFLGEINKSWCMTHFFLKGRRNFSKGILEYQSVIACETCQKRITNDAFDLHAIYMGNHVGSSITN